MWIDNQIFEHSHHQVCLRNYVVNETCVVLGRSNKAELECNLDHTSADGIPILKRAGGGGTVLLYSGCAIVSLGLWLDHPFNNQYFFEQINDSVASSVNDILNQTQPIRQRGISDLAVGDRKIAGTSMFRSKGYLLYQASIIVDLDIQLIERYLAHPSSEPDYRRGKSHRDFLAGLSEFDVNLSSQKLVEGFDKYLEVHLMNRLSKHLVEPDLAHVKHLKSRIR